MCNAIVFLFLPVAPEPALSEELKALQGEWQAISVVEKGEKWNKEETGEIVLEISGDTLLYKRNNPAEKFRMTLDTKQKPAHLDLRLIAKDVDPDKACHAIYSLENGKLTLCLPTEFTANKSEERPKEFSTEGKRPPSGTLLVILQRTKKK